MKNPYIVGGACFLSKVAAITGIIAACFSAQSIEAQPTGNPYSGYNTPNYYFLSYSNGTSFTQGNTSDVQVTVTIAGTNHIIDVDTGSRGLYMSSEELGPNFSTNVSGTFAGEIDLDSSGRVSSGIWVPTTVSLNVTDQNGTPTTVTSTCDILDVTTLSAQAGRTATYGVNGPAGSKINLHPLGSGTVTVTGTTGSFIVSLSGTQQITYADNPGAIQSGSNFGIGFDLSGSTGGTGPVGNNMNQIYNVLINLDAMRNGTIVAGYIIKTTGIQLGLSSNETGYAYTPLNSTGLTSTNSVPDWQTPTGQTVTNGVTNAAGGVVLDSGIPNSFISAPGLTLGGTITKPMSVYLMNSGGAVGYKISLTDTANVLNPTSVLVVAAGTAGTYTQSAPPYQGQFFNSGRNVFEDFNMLYDAQNGYMGVLPNSHGLTDTNVFFKAQAGGFPNPTDVFGGNPVAGNIAYSYSPWFGFYGNTYYPIVYDFNLGFEYGVADPVAGVYLYDYQSTHWWYTAGSEYPFLYDFTLNSWLYYYTNNPAGGTRYFYNFSSNPPGVITQ